VLKQALQTTGQEITTGVSADLTERLSGDFGPLSAIERSLTAIESYNVATSEAKLTANAMQLALTNLSGTMSGLDSSLVLAGTEPQSTLIDAAGHDAYSKFEQAVSALNSSIAGRSLFAGAQTDLAPLISGPDILAAVEAAVAGETTAQGIADAVNAWFTDPSGDYEVLAYQGATQGAGPVRLAEGQSLSLDITALDPAVREALAGLATGALLANRTTLGGDVDARSDLAEIAGIALLSAEGGLATLQAELGVAQERIELIETENATHASVLELARSDLIGVDPYHAATRLEALQAQLETLYTLTARVSRLSLADYLS